MVIAASASRPVINHSDSKGSCHLVMFDHSPELIESVIYLQFACATSVNSGRMIVKCGISYSSPLAQNFPDLKICRRFPGAVNRYVVRDFALAVIFSERKWRGSLRLCNSR
jgi:hypothetical protein